MPSKKFIIVVLIILLLGAGVFWFYNNEKLGEKNKIIFEKQGSLIPLQQNSGNSDWEQVLERTSAYSSVDKNLLSNQATDMGSEQINETEKFSQNFLSQYLLAKQITDGGNLNTAAKDNLVNSLIAGLDYSSSPAYKLSDLKISEDNSETAIRNYGNKLISIVRSYNDPAP
jgi:hypothetical protein